VLPVNTKLARGRDAEPQPHQPASHNSYLFICHSTSLAPTGYRWTKIHVLWISHSIYLPLLFTCSYWIPLDKDSCAVDSPLYSFESHLASTTSPARESLVSLLN
jgi:hypothetical protein